MKTQPIVAHGRGLTVRLHRGQVTIRPAIWVRLAQPSARTARFAALEVVARWSPPRWGRAGFVVFDLGEDEGGQPRGWLVKYGRASRREFAQIVNAGNWQEVQQW